jgi:SAM-dependent methyltransferase
MNIDAKETVQEYYGRVLQTKADLQTSACCTAEAMPAYLRPYLCNIHEAVSEKFYGCGSPIPPAVEGCTVLDLGCGSGRDAYLMSQLVGPAGQVIGVDMTDEQLAVANTHVEWHTQKFGYAKPNVTFRKGYIEDLGAAGVADNSVDVVISNCVINLSPDKDAVFKEIFRVLKPGGELYFSDVFAGRRVPDHLKHDPILVGECLGGALYIEDFRRALRAIGCLDYRVVNTQRLDLNNPALAAKAGMIDFYSMTIRAFKHGFEDLCEDYGQVATYLGTIPASPHSFVLDDHHEFFTGRPMLVCGNTAMMVGETRFAPHFKIDGDRSTHYGPFDCAPALVLAGADDAAQTSACC